MRHWRNKIRHLKYLRRFKFQAYENRRAKRLNIKANLSFVAAGYGQKIRYLKSLSCFNLQEYGCRREIKRFDAKTDLDFVTASFSEYWNFTENGETPTVYNIPEDFKLRLDKLPLFCLQILTPNGANAKKLNIIQRIPMNGDWRRQYFFASKNWGEWVNIRDAITRIQEDQNLQEFFLKNWNSYDVIASYDARIINGIATMRRQRVTELTSLEKLLDQIKNGTAKNTPNVIVESLL
jgi:hypothetical protein